ncbi:hypothetical protein J6590_057624 [Homalodisca vitripennis]|nr:hypothetical protein J6590_057624 [Homalodisca vitripennis]
MAAGNSGFYYSNNVASVTKHGHPSTWLVAYLKPGNILSHSDVTILENRKEQISLCGVQVCGARGGGGEPVLSSPRYRTDYARLDQLLDSADWSLVYNQADASLAFDEFWELYKVS